MLKKIIILFLVAMNVAAELTSEEIQQLHWLDNHNQRSYDAHTDSDNWSTHIEIRRASTRMQCLELLRQGDIEAYNKFVASQSTARLSLPTFNKLSKYIKRLGSKEYIALRKAVIITAVSLTPEAKKLISELEFINNSADFSAAMVRATESERLFYIMFLPKTQLRHMLYAEGGQNIYAVLNRMIQMDYIKQDDLDLWFAYWIVNIAGYRGHVNSEGSVYLSECVASAMLELKTHIDIMLSSPQYDAMSKYLEYRAKIIGLQDLPLKERITLAHLAAMFRVFTPVEGKYLYSCFLDLPKTTQHELVEYFDSKIHEREIITHAPVLFANVLAYTGGDLRLVFTRLIQTYLSAAKLSNKSFSFNHLSQIENVKQLISAKDPLTMVITPDQEVSLLLQ